MKMSWHDNALTLATHNIFMHFEWVCARSGRHYVDTIQMCTIKNEDGLAVLLELQRWKRKKTENFTFHCLLICIEYAF